MIRRLQAGDRMALATLYRTHAETAVRTAYLITRNKATAEDAVHEAFVQVMRSASTLRDPTSFRPWFYRIVVNAAKRLTRKAKRSLPLDQQSHDKIDLSGLSPEEVAIGIEEIQMVRSAIVQLSEAHREVVILRYYTGLSEEDIALALDLPSGTVKSRLHRAREALQRLLTGMKHSPDLSGAPGQAAWPRGGKG